MIRWAILGPGARNRKLLFAIIYTGKSSPFCVKDNFEEELFPEQFVSVTLLVGDFVNSGHAHHACAVAEQFPAALGCVCEQIQHFSHLPPGQQRGHASAKGAPASSSEIHAGDWTQTSCNQSASDPGSWCASALFANNLPVVSQI